jgi:hypothetical protein
MEALIIEQGWGFMENEGKIILRFYEIIYIFAILTPMKDDSSYIFSLLYIDDSLLTVQFI